MVDKISKERRSKNMSAIRSTHTKLEDTITKELWHRGIRFRKNVKDLKGKPDIAIKKYKMVIFIDSCFWHYCKDHGQMPKSNPEFWEKKFQKNVDNDITITKYYKEKGWNIRRIWEHELKADFSNEIASLIEFIYLSQRVQKANPF